MTHWKVIKRQSTKYTLMYMEYLKTLTNEYLGISVNVYKHNGDLWFTAYEVAAILKYKNRREVIKYNIPDNKKMRVKKKIEFLNGKIIESMVIMVNEPGLYRF